MRFNPAPFISQIAGRMGEEVYNYRRNTGAHIGIQYLKRYSAPYNPNTPAQQAVRSAFGNSFQWINQAQSKTIGGTSFDVDSFLAESKIIFDDSGYRGGDSGNLFAGAGVANRAEPTVAPVVIDLLLPQDCTTEPQLQSVIDASYFLLNYMRTMKQKVRVGYI